ncbi:MAG: anion permease [Candidatus Kerfeldbacteria bacterium]|nr:anion permease [Candidatus Kerfeldbacteria bacterium]
METGSLTLYALISIFTLLAVYVFLISEKIHKVIVVMLAAALLIFLQVFRTPEHSSQTGALEYVKNNLDVLGFIIGMMILVGVVRESGIFESLAIRLVKFTQGKPRLLLVVFAYLTLMMTTFLSNIPTILILSPVLLVLIRELKLPYLPYFFVMITMANIGGAMTPISDPTTYYQAKTVGLGFMEVVSNSGMIVLILSVVTVLYTLLVFRKPLARVHIKAKDIEMFDPKSAIKNRKILAVGMPVLILAILLMIGREAIFNKTGVTLDNATITFAGAFLLLFIFEKEVKHVLEHMIDWEIIFFFTGLFIVVGSLEFTGVIHKLADVMITLTHGNSNALLFFITVGSGTLSTFIDNVPYNIAMVGAIKAMAASGIFVYPLWWALNLGTSIGGAGSPIGAACNVIAFGQAEQAKLHTVFLKYLVVAFPLVLINSLVAYGALYLRYLS